MSICSQFFTRISLGFFLLVTFSSTNAATIQFFAGSTLIQHTSGTGGTTATDFVEKDGYRFETFQGNALSINSNVIQGHVGGLRDSLTFGRASALQITRIDGQAFSINRITYLEHAGLLCRQNYCGIERIILEGIASADGSTFSVGGPSDGYNNTYETFNPLLADTRFGDVDKVVLDIHESFILDSINLTAVPLPPALWLFGSGIAGLLLRIRNQA